MFSVDGGWSAWSRVDVCSAAPCSGRCSIMRRVFLWIMHLIYISIRSQTELVEQYLRDLVFLRLLLSNCYGIIFIFIFYFRCYCWLYFFFLLQIDCNNGSYSYPCSGLKGHRTIASLSRMLPLREASS